MSAKDSNATFGSTVAIIIYDKTTTYALVDELHNSNGGFILWTTNKIVSS